MAETLSGCLLSFIQNETTPTIGGCLLPFVQSETQSVSGCLLSFNQSETQSVSGCLLSFRQREFNTVTDKWKFQSLYEQEPYNIEVYIDNDLIKPCLLKGSLEINKSVNQAKTANLSIAAKCDNNNAIDLYQYAGKIIEIFYSSKTRYTLLYRGMVAIQKLNIDEKVFELTCTDEKINKINNLSEYQLNNIGFYSKYIFTENLTTEQNFSKRMESIPYDYYFDDNNRFVLTAWQPKNTPDLIINTCQILDETFSYSVMNLGEIVNKINLKFQFNYFRKIQRDIKVNYHSGAGGTMFNQWVEFSASHNFIAAPPVNAVMTAANGAGWVVGNFVYSPIPSLAGTGLVVHNLEYYAATADWTISKRWVQNIQENIGVELKNSCSIGFFGEKSDELSFSVKIENEDDKWANDYQCYFRPHSNQAANGDYIIDLSQNAMQEYNNAMLYALNVAKTKMLNSHFGNECNFNYVFTPDLELRHTLGMNTNAIRGNLRVQEFTHSIDFDKKMSVTKIRAKWFKGFGGDDISIPQRAIAPVSNFVNRPIEYHNQVITEYSTDYDGSAGVIPSSGGIQVADYCIAKDGLDNLYGYVMKETVLNDLDPNIKQGTLQAVKFAVKTPDIEKESTDALELSSDFVQNIAIPNTAVITYLPCRNRG